jgi:hypothetical protein
VKDTDGIFIVLIIASVLTLAVGVALIILYFAIIVISSLIIGVQTYLHDLVFVITGRDSVAADKLFAGILSAAVFYVIASQVIPIFLQEAARYIT